MKVIYLRKNLINGKCYIGQTKNYKIRNYNWKFETIYANAILTKDRDLYGLDNFESSILKECDDSSGDYWENYYIDEYNTLFPNGYNIKRGGLNGWHHTDNTRLKMSTSHMKQVYQYTLDGELVRVWESTLECASNGFNQGHVAACCRGEEKKHKGFRWSYKPL